MPKAAFDGELVGGLNFVKGGKPMTVKTNSDMGVKSIRLYNRNEHMGNKINKK